MNSILAASAWTSDITNGAAQIVTDCLVGIGGGIVILFLIIGVYEVKAALKAASNK